MSRVDEALRRAGAQAPTPEAGLSAALPAPLPVGVVAEDGPYADLFPVEASEPAVSSEPVVRHEAPPAAATVTARAPEAPVSGSVFARIDARLAEKVIVDDNMMPVSREQYRRLAAILHDAQADRGLKVIMVASAVAGEGKTLTAANLALTLSESYRQRVLLIDGDLRRPALHQVFRVDAASGLSDGLTGGDETKLLVRQISPRLALLPAGRPTPDPMAGLTSNRMRRVVAEAREAFDWVIIDTPPLVQLPDAHLLAPIADGLLLVVQANSTAHELVSRAVDAIGRERVLGVVLNGTAEGPRGSTDTYYGYGYTTAPPRR